MTCPIHWWPRDDNDKDKRKDKDKDKDKENDLVIYWISDLVTQLTVPDKLKNSNHDIEG